MYATSLSAGLNGLEADQVHEENGKQTSAYTRLVPSKLNTACNERVQ